MKLHLRGIGDHAQSTIIIEHVDLVGAPTTEDMKKKKEHNQAMMEISSTLSYAEFDDIKGLNSTKKMWESLATIYGGDTNVLRAKAENIRGNFDKMRMEEDANITQYVARINELVNAIVGV